MTSSVQDDSLTTEAKEALIDEATVVRRANLFLPLACRFQSYICNRYKLTGCPSQRNRDKSQWTAKPCVTVHAIFAKISTRQSRNFKKRDKRGSGTSKPRSPRPSRSCKGYAKRARIESRLKTMKRIPYKPRTFLLIMFAM